MEVCIKKLLLILTLMIAAQGAQAADLTFQGFPWGTSMETFVARMGQPVSRDQTEGFVSLLWENVFFLGFRSFMVAYFSSDGLQGGIYYFLTNSMDETIRCYSDLQRALFGRHGETPVFDAIGRELRSYASSWTLPSGLARLRVDTRNGDPVTLWYSSPELTRAVLGE